MHGGLDLIAQQGALRRLEILEGVIAFEELGILGTDIAVRRTPPARHQVILRRIHRNAVQPGIKGTVATKIAQRPVSLDESFLRHILGFLGVVHETHDQPEYLVLVLEYQQIERALVSTLDPLDQLLVRFLGLHSCSSKRPESSCVTQ
ncbi:hypothetical protein D3C78_1073020 [compost metagenome]